LETAAHLSIPYFKFGYYHYKFVDVRKELEAASNEFKRLAELGSRYGMQGGYHNHERYIGSPIWDIARVMDTLDPKWVGYYFDLRHATAEGGVGCWKISMNLVMPRLKMLAVKDFYWEKTEKGWNDKGCPLGEGMCHWNEFFQAMASTNFRGPVSLHLEYETPGVADSEGIALSRSQEPHVMAIAKRDLDVLKAGLREAYGQA
jgi:sugar phosphate isomerase/epimerase